jgi:Ca2+-binding RTX toxin-like protein
MMATVSLNASLNSDDFWRPIDTAITKTSTIYEFQNDEGQYVRVTGTSLAYDGDNPLSGNYTQIAIFSDSGFNTQIASYSSATAIDFATYFSSGGASALAGGDAITGSGLDDIITSYGGADSIDGGAGDDIYQFNPGDVVLGEVINDGGNQGETDGIALIGNTGVVDFTLAFASGFEGVSFAGNALQAHFNAAQLPTALSLTALSGLAHSLHVFATASFSADGWTFGTWNDSNDHIVIHGDTANNTITGSDKADVIIAGLGADTLNGGDGGDAYQYDSGGDIETGETIADTGAGGTDTIYINGNSDCDFRSATMSGIEKIWISSAGTARFNASQLAALPSNLAFEGFDTVAQTVTVSDASNFSAAGWTFDNWGDQFDRISISGSLANGNDTITGSSQTDIIAAGSGADVVHAGDGDDAFGFFVSSDIVSGDVMDGGDGTDRFDVAVDLDFRPATITSVEALNFAGGGSLATFNAAQLPSDFAVRGVNSAAQTIAINEASNFSADAWTFSNWEAADTLAIGGTAGADTVVGSNARDVITGGLGKDSLSGGLDADRFDYNDLYKAGNESLKGGAQDVILDFAHGTDKIDLQDVDAKKGSGNQAFKFIKARPFHDKAGELHVVKKGGILLVEGDIDGNGKADFQIEVHGAAALTKADFVL